MLILTATQEASLLAVLEGRQTSADIDTMKSLHRNLVGRRTFRLGIEQTQEIAAQRRPAPPGFTGQDRA